VVSGIRHPRFVATMQAIMPNAVPRIEAITAQRFVDPATTLPRYA
jgi:hypothetical protein